MGGRNIKGSSSRFIGAIIGATMGLGIVLSAGIYKTGAPKNNYQFELSSNYTPLDLNDNGKYDVILDKSTGEIVFYTKQSSSQLEKDVSE